MKIAMVAGHACIRVQKMALPLLEKGHTVHLLAHKRPVFWEHYDSFMQAASTRQFLEAFKVYEDKVDLFHCHNEPSWFVTALKEITKKPVILDVHDSWLSRMTQDELQFEREKNKDTEAFRISVEERNNFQLADGLVFVSKPHSDIVTKEFDLLQPNLILPSYVPNFAYSYQAGTSQWLGGVIYEGRVDIPDETKNGSKWHGFRYCVYLDLAKKFKEKGIPFHLYPGRDLSLDQKFIDTYGQYAILHQAKEYSKLLNSICVHDWGLVGNLDYSPNWEVALPNKFFEYIAAMVPVVSMNASGVSDIIKEHGIGISVSSVEELMDRWMEHEQCRKALPRARHFFSMDNHINELETFYRQFI